jgi:hypothetical protein
LEYLAGDGKSVAPGREEQGPDRERAGRRSEQAQERGTGDHEAAVTGLAFRAAQIDPAGLRVDVLVYVAPFPGFFVGEL